MFSGITAIGLIFASYHFDREKVYNEVNPGIFVELDNEYVFGAYRNSFNRVSVFVGRNYPLAQFAGIKWGGVLAVCTGYDSPVCGSLNLSVGNFNLSIVPPLGKKFGGVVGFSYRIPL